jgi:hypothetical protein
VRRVTSAPNTSGTWEYNHWEYNVRAFYVLRIKEVLTADRLRCAEDAISSYLETNRVFGPRRIGRAARWLLYNESICRVTKWCRYYDAAVRVDVMFLRRCLLGDARSSTRRVPWIPPPMIERAMRAEFRLRYFCNRACRHYNYRLTQQRVFYATFYV